MPATAISVLFVASEIAPWAKTGGLGDVAAALPPALHRLGLDVRVLLPGYPALLKAFPQRILLADLPRPGGELPPAQLTRVRAGGVPILLVECPELFMRAGGIYQTGFGIDWRDNHLRFGLLSRVAALLSSLRSPLGWRPQILHCHDWQTALAPVYLHYDLPPAAASVLTIHNLAYQGLFSRKVLGDLGLPDEAYSIEGVEFWGKLSFMKGGLQHAHRITTVSPTYAREIHGTEEGRGLEGLIRYRSHRLRGILNGIDTDEWNPGKDPCLPQAYDVDTLEEGKAASKQMLQMQMGLAQEPDAPLICAIARLVPQKGLDLLLESAEALIERGAQIVVLGSGLSELEEGFFSLALRHPGRVGAMIGYDEALAHLIEAGGDIFVMPSRFEPCGLNQMYSLRYGTPPVVRATGGLADTVIDTTPSALADGSATGFTFSSPTVEAFLGATLRAMALYADKPAWRQLQRNGMEKDFSWNHAAREYVSLYQQLLWPGPQPLVGR